MYFVFLLLSCARLWLQDPRLGQWVVDGLCQEIACRCATDDLFERLHDRLPVSGSKLRLYQTAAFKYRHGVFNKVQQRFHGNLPKASAPQRRGNIRRRGNDVRCSRYDFGTRVRAEIVAQYN